MQAHTPNLSADCAPDPIASDGGVAHKLGDNRTTRRVLPYHRHVLAPIFDGNAALDCSQRWGQSPQTPAGSGFAHHRCLEVERQRRPTLRDCADRRRRRPAPSGACLNGFAMRLCAPDPATVPRPTFLSIRTSVVPRQPHVAQRKTQPHHDREPRSGPTLMSKPQSRSHPCVASSRPEAMISPRCRVRSAT